MYPDRDDAKNAMAKLTGVPQPPVDDVWETAVFIREFLEQAQRACRNHGRHEFVPASLLRTQTEDFIGKKITEYEFCLGFLLLPPPNYRIANFFGSPLDVSRFIELQIKFPPTQRVGEFREDWKRIQAETEKEIERERERIANLFK